MAITTYSELKSAVADTLNRDDLTSVIPNFISLAESQIAREVRHWRMEKRVSTAVTTQYSDLPTDFVGFIRLSVEDYPLALMSRDEMQAERFKSSDTGGRPTGYALTGGSIELYPTPNQSYDLELIYYGSITALSDTDTSNWLLQYASDVYLYAALLQTAPYLQHDERLAVWSSLYQQAVDKLNRSSANATASGTNLSMKIRSY
jgi:hypothetical protein